MATMIPSLTRIDPPKLVGTGLDRELEDDLIRMGCAGFYERPWRIAQGHAVLELLPGEQPRGPIRSNPRAWTTQVWRDVYSLAPENWKYKLDKALLEKHITGEYDVSECYRSS